MRLRLLRNKGFAVLLFRESATAFGSICLQMALGLHLLATTGSAGRFAAILSLALIPNLTLGLFAGHWVDRSDKTRLLQGLDAARGLLFLGLSLAVMGGFAPAMAGFIGILALSTCDLLAGPAYLTLLPHVIEKHHLVDANAIETTFVETVRVAAPLAGTWIYASFGLPGAFWVVGGTFMASWIAACTLAPLPGQDTAISRPSERHPVRTLVRIFQRDGRLVSLVGNGMLTHFALFPFVMVGFPYIVKRVFNGSDMALGTVESFQALGSILAILPIAFLNRRWNLPQNIGWGLMAMLATCLPLLALGHRQTLATLIANPGWAVASLCAVGFLIFLAFDTYGVFFRSFYLQEVAPEHMGKFASVMIFAFTLARMMGFALFGRLFDHHGLLVPAGLLGIGMVLKIVTHLPFMRMDRLRRQAGDSSSAPNLGQEPIV